jgi:hypothetical protein
VVQVQLTNDRRAGVVYIAEIVPDNPDPHGARFRGHWERQDSPRMIEKGPEWPSADLAIAWGRERCDVVLIRIGEPGIYYSAGDIDPLGTPLPRWPAMPEGSPQ